MKTIPRLLLLLFSLSAITMLFIGRCGLNMDAHSPQAPRALPSLAQDRHPRIDRRILRELRGGASVQEGRAARQEAEVTLLRKRVADLEGKLHQAELKIYNLSRPDPARSLTATSSMAISEFTFPERNTSEEYAQYFQERLLSAEIIHGVPMKSEYEVIPFNRFTLNRIYLVDPGLGKRVVEKPIGYKKKDLFEIVTYAMDRLNKNQSSWEKPYTLEDFVEGIYRTGPTSGSHYELFFHSNRQRGPNAYSRVVVMRPFGPPMEIKQEAFSTDQMWINLILPLSGRVDTFRMFMERFVQVCVKQDQRVYLTVVYFGTEGLKEVKVIMSQMARQHKFKHMKLVTLNEKFTRGRGLQIGALNWKSGDVLLFLCDVDIVFTPDFLERCRFNTERGKRVYYPIVFSLYNPNVVYALQDMPIPSLRDQLIISKDTGFWRDFGYGMTCQYRSDFLKVKGFDEQITGWGGEDVFLYQKYVRSEYIVTRATDHGIFHLWHEKVCLPSLTPEQYRSCIRSKALNEASHAQLGLLAFKDEIDIHRNIAHQQQGRD